MKVNFTKLKVEVSFDSFKVLNVSKELGNTIHQNTCDIGVDDTARAIYHANGEVEIPDEQLESIRSIISNSYLLVAFKKAILQVLEEPKKDSEK